MLDSCVAFTNHYPRGAMLARVLAVIVCLSVRLSVCVSVTRRYCIKTAKRRITQTTPRDSPGTLVFLTPTVVGERPPFRWKFALKVTHPPFEHHDFDQYMFIAPQPRELAKKSSKALIKSRPRALQRAIGEPCTLVLSCQKGSTKRDFAVCVSKIQLLSKEVCYKVFFL